MHQKGWLTMPSKTDNKQRRYFSLNQRDKILAHGVLYRDGNVQILYRADCGWTGEQYQSIANVIGLMPGITRLQFYNNQEQLNMFLCIQKGVDSLDLLELATLNMGRM